MTDGTEQLDAEQQCVARDDFLPELHIVNLQEVG